MTFCTILEDIFAAKREARDDAQHIAVHSGEGCASGNGTDGGCSVTTDAGQFQEFVKLQGNLPVVFIHNDLRGFLQIACAVVITESLPEFHELVIRNSGKGSNIRISSPSQYPSLDAEAVRLVKLVDHWNPIIISGKAVKDESAIVPVKFRLPQPPEDQVEEVVVHKTVTEVNEPYVPVQKTLAKNPTYPGGMVEMTKFISSQTKYPKKELKENIEGDVKVKFMVQEDGSISNIQVIEHVSPGLDAEAVRIVNTMPKWNPAVATDGTNMPCEMSIPVNFRTPKAIDGYVWPQYQNKK